MNESDWEELAKAIIEDAKEVKKVKKPKGEYIICVEEDDIVYSTDSPFWRDFFR